MAGPDPGLIQLFTVTDIASPSTLATLLAGGLVFGQAKRRRQEQRIDLALHELRRPLQALLLQPSSARRQAGRELTTVDLALAALADLEAALDRARGPSMVPVSAPAGRTQGWEQLLTDAADRWQQAAWIRGGSIEVECQAESGMGLGAAEAIELARALDNLILNALIHGGGHVVLQARCNSAHFELRVCDQGHRELDTKIDRRPTDGAPQLERRRLRRHGQGLKAVRQIAASRGGNFDLHRDDDGAVAVLKLPRIRGKR